MYLSTHVALAIFLCCYDYSAKLSIRETGGIYLQKPPFQPLPWWRPVSLHCVVKRAKKVSTVQGDNYTELLHKKS